MAEWRENRGEVKWAVMRLSIELSLSSWSKRWIDAIFLGFTLLFGTLQVYACRHELDPDGMDYLDIARELSAGHWSAIANGYWGTLNSLFLSPLFSLRPSASAELPMAHAEALLVLIAAFFAFRFFLNICVASIHTADDCEGQMSPLPDLALRILGYALFLWCSLELVPVKTIGPDLLVTVFLYLAGGVLLGLQKDAPLWRFAIFGALLGAAYWAKAIMFPVGLVFLAVSAVKARSWKKCFVAAVLFALVAAPLVLALSLPRGRFTFGDSGKLAYSTLVSPGGRGINWQGEPAASGTPVHATRLLPVNPPIYEFNGPIAGTYPPSYDPSYWEAGRKSTFELRAQLRVLATNVPHVAETLLLAQPAITVVFLFLVLFNPQGYLRRLLRRSDLIFVSLAVIGLYVLVLVETRYVGAYVLFLWMAGYLAIRIPVDSASQRASTISIVAVVAVMLLSVLFAAAKNFAQQCPESAREDIKVAELLNLPPGTPVAIIGRGNFAYWAHFARLHFVAEMMGQEEAAFWRLSFSDRAQVYRNFNSTGARYLFARAPDNPQDGLEPAWQRVGDSSWFVYTLW